MDFRYIFMKVIEFSSKTGMADLFAPLPPTEDCAVCLVPLSRLNSETCYQACCGKDICKACYKENRESVNKQNEEKNAGKKIAFTCPFCREPEATCFDEGYARLQARCLQKDHIAFTQLGGIYRKGEGIWSHWPGGVLLPRLTPT